MYLRMCLFITPSPKLKNPILPANRPLRTSVFPATPLFRHIWKTQCTVSATLGEISCSYHPESLHISMRQARDYIPSPVTTSLEWRYTVGYASTCSPHCIVRIYPPLHFFTQLPITRAFVPAVQVFFFFSSWGTTPTTFQLPHTCRDPIGHATTGQSRLQYLK